LVVLRFLSGWCCIVFEFFGIVVVTVVACVSLVGGGSGVVGRASGDGLVNIGGVFFLLDLEVETLELLAVPLSIPLVIGGKAMTTTKTVLLVVVLIETK
jgi:hypothetical protein